MNNAMMKSAILRQFGQPLTIEGKPIPAPGPGEVLVKVRASGLCVSDLHIQDGIISTVRLPIRRVTRWLASSPKWVKASQT